MKLWASASPDSTMDSHGKSLSGLDPEETALLVIDVQRGLFGRSQPIFLADELLLNINFLANRFREAGAPVVYIQHNNQKMLRRGTPEWEIHPELERKEGDVLIEKEHGNAFQDTSLGEEMNKRGILNLVITGLVTHGCVRATCEGGFVLGYRVILVADGHSNYHKRAGELISEWNQKLADGWVELLPTDEVHFHGRPV